MAENQIPLEQRQKYYLSRVSDDLVNPKTREARKVKTCVIDKCNKKTHRTNAVKCFEHRGICAFNGCKTPSWDKGQDLVAKKSNGKSYQYQYGKDFRYCSTHKSRVRAQRKLEAPKHSTGLSEATEEDLAIEKVYTSSTNKDGYIVKFVRTASGATRNILEHRMVMEEYLGRPLFPHENVHHLNGDRADNRLDNLELWSISQPPGQRVQDKIAHYKEFLEQYGLKVELTNESATYFDESKVEERKSQILHFRHPDFQDG